jgi:hypothetical protein
MPRLRAILVRFALGLAAVNFVIALIKGELFVALATGGVGLSSAAAFAGLFVKVWRFGMVGEAGDYFYWLVSWIFGVLFLVGSIVVCFALLVL